MRLEHIPLILGVIVALIGLGFIADASMAASAPVTPERRRRTRAEPSRAGEAVVGIGTLCMAAALFGRDTWRYGTVVVLVGSVLLLIGVILNRAFLKEALLFRGPARRSDGGTPTSGQGQGGTGGIHRRHAPAQPDPTPTPRPAPAPPPLPASASRSSSAPATPGGTSRPAPTPPPVRPPQPEKQASPSSGAVRHPTPPVASRAYQPSEPPAPAPPPPPAQPPKGPQERRKTPRGKR